MTNKKTSSGLDRNTAAALSYVGFWITGLIFFLIEKEDKFIRFHALQSLILFGFLNILMVIPVISWILNPILLILGFISWLVCIIKAYQGEEFMLPFIGQLAKNNLKKTKSDTFSR
jgi:uncharacterized membrane protein